MRIRINGTGDRGRNYFLSATFDLADSLDMDLAIACWKENEDKYDKLTVLDAATGKTPVEDPLEHLAFFYAHVK